MSEDGRCSFTAAREGIERCTEAVEGCAKMFRTARVLMFVSVICTGAAGFLFTWSAFLPALVILAVGIVFYVVGWEISRFAHIRLESEQRFLDTYKAMLELVGLPSDVKT